MKAIDRHTSISARNKRQVKHWQRIWEKEAARLGTIDPPKVPVPPLPHLVNRPCPGSIAYGFLTFRGLVR